MSKIVSKILISLCFGVIVGIYFGNKYKIDKYYNTEGAKREVTLIEYNSEIKSSAWAEYYLHERKFNSGMALQYSLIVSCTVCILLLLPELKK